MNEEKKYQVIKAVVEGKKQKKRASIELSLSIRQINRLVKNYKEKGKITFAHKNRGTKRENAVPEETKQYIVSTYQHFNTKPNVKHFTEILKEDYGVSYSDTTIRSILYKENILSPKSQRKTRKRIKQLIKQKAKNQKQAVDNSLVPLASDYLELKEKVHPSRPRKKYQGELIQLDASSYRWFSGDVTHLHIAIDDASGNIVGAYFDTQETLKGYYHVLNQILTKQGIPVTFLTDKRTVFEYQRKDSKKMEEDTSTQFGFACRELGIDIKTSSVPEAKGRVERLNQTVQSRLPVELEQAGISTIDQANEFLTKWIVAFNRQFGNKTTESVYEKSPTKSEINLLLAVVSERKVDSGHHIKYQNKFYIPTEGRETKYFTRRTKALVIKAFNGDIYVNIAEKIYTTRLLESHEMYSKEFDVMPKTKKERRKYIPPQSHPWKLESFKRYLRSIDRTIEEYESSKTA